MNKNSSFIKSIFKMIKYKPGLYMFNGFLSIFLFTYNTVPILITREILNRISIGNRLDSSILWLLALLIGAGLARVTLILINGFTYNMNMFTLSNLIRRNMIEKILNKKDTVSVSASSGEAINSFKEDVANCVAPLDGFLDIIGTTAYTVTAITFLVYINPTITLFVFTPLAIIVLIIRKMADRIRNNRRKNRAITSNISEVIGDISSSIQTIKVLGAQQNILNHFDKLNKKRHKIVMQDAFFMTLLNSITDSAVHFGTAIILLFVAQSMRVGNFSVGDFSVFVYYLSSVADYMQRLGSFISRLKQSEISFERINTMLKEEKAESIVEHKPIYTRGEIRELPYSINNSKSGLEKLEVKGLTHKYLDNKGISDISFSLNKGDFVVIAGRIGAGKTTLLETFLGITQAHSGKIFWNGEEIEKPHTFLIPPKVGYTPQVPRLFMDTVRQNILLGLREETTSLDNAIHLAVLENDLTQLEKGLDTVAGTMGSKLSGGQQQRIALARMFARECELLVFDDVSSALDIETEITLWQRLAKHRRINNTTCIVVSNRKTVLQQAGHIIVLKDGKVESQGSLEELLVHSPEFQGIWGEETVVA